MSVLSSKMSELAWPLLVLAITHSPVQAGVAGFAAALPKALFQLPAGAWVDRWNRRQVMIGCDLGRLLAIVSIPLVGISYSQLVVTAFVHTTLSVPFDLAERAALPDVVDPRALPAAVAQNHARTQGAMVIGAALGGALFGISRVLPFVAGAASYLVSLVTLVRIRTPLQAPPTARAGRLHHDIAAGVRFVWDDRCLRTLSMVSAVFSPLVSGIPLVLIVLFTHRGATPGLVGTILGIGGVGGLLGATLAPYLVRTVPAGTLNLAGRRLAAALILAMGLVGSAVALGTLSAGLAAEGAVTAVVSRRAGRAPRSIRSPRLRCLSQVFPRRSWGGPRLSLQVGGLTSYHLPRRSGTAGHSCGSTRVITVWVTKTT